MRLWYVPATLAILFALTWIFILLQPVLLPGSERLDSKVGELGTATAVTILASWYTYPR